MSVAALASSVVVRVEIIGMSAELSETLVGVTRVTIPCGDVATHKVRLVGNLVNYALSMDASSQDSFSVCCFLFVFSVVCICKAGDRTSVASGDEEA